MSDDRDDDEFDLETFNEDDLDFLEGSKSAIYAPGEQTGDRTIVIRTSDRATFRRCRRKHSWSFSGGQNLRPQSESGPFWLGSGLHFALEDFHGYRYFQYARDALKAYAEATTHTGLDLPQEAGELLELGQGMLDYYEAWLETRESLNTLWINGEPQVEVQIHIELPKEDLIRYCPQHVLDLYDRILYQMTLDRVAIDVYSRLWLVEYKSAKNFQHFHLDTDGQVNAYSWGITLRYPNHEIAGVCYQQHKKQVPKAPEFLKSTKLFSTSKRQKTTYALYRTALRNLYGPTADRWPEPNRMYLDYLIQQESQDKDNLIRRDFVERNTSQIQSEYQKILMETSEIINPDTLLYPNPTWNCGWDCSFQLPCVHYDSGLDWQSELRSYTIPRDQKEIQWRQFLQLPGPPLVSKEY